MKQHFLKHLDLIDTSHPTKQVFLDFITEHDTNIQHTNPSHHFCSFFLPYDPKSHKIFLVHHKKANDWIPPGGHIEPNENPLDTVYREFQEELSHKLTNEKIELFDISLKDVSKPGRICAFHYDFWHVVYTDLIDFKYDPGEFYDAKWVTFEEAKKLTALPEYNQIIQKLTQKLK